MLSFATNFEEHFSWIYNYLCFPWENNLMDFELTIICVIAY